MLNDKDFADLNKRIKRVRRYNSLQKSKNPFIRLFPTGKESLKYLVYTSGTSFSHVPVFKVIINNILKKLQFWEKEPYIITSKFGKGFIEFLGYGFKRIRVFKKSSVLISVYDIIQRKEAMLYKDGIKLKKSIDFFSNAPEIVISFKNVNFILPFFLRMCLENETTRDKIKIIDLNEDDIELTEYIKEILKKEKNGKST